MKRPPMDPVFRAAVRESGERRCAYCGGWLPDEGWAAHHRLLRSQGGKDSLENVIGLHHHCHEKVHDRPAVSYNTGFLVPRYHGDPATWRVHRFHRNWQQPGDMGWITAPPHPAQLPDSEQVVKRCQ